MLISHKEQFCFIHNPKCAGTTIRNSLSKFCENNYYWLFKDIDGVKVDKAHMRASFFQKNYLEDYNKVLNYFTFGIVRNPYDRAVSAYNEIHKSSWSDFRKGIIRKDEYMSDLNDFISKISVNKISGNFPRFRHGVRQQDMFFNNGKCIADLIIKLEELGDAQMLLKPFSNNLSKVAESWSEKKRNVKKSNIDYLQLLNDSSIKHINTIYENDFCIFRYSKV
jgi:hypothetical protein